VVGLRRGCRHFATSTRAVRARHGVFLAMGPGWVPTKTKPKDNLVYFIGGSASQSATEWSPSTGRVVVSTDAKWLEWT
jgi:hypothetical protein